MVMANLARNLQYVFFGACCGAVPTAGSSGSFPVISQGVSQEVGAEEHNNHEGKFGSTGTSYSSR